jgi:hypothetical protein
VPSRGNTGRANLETPNFYVPPDYIKAGNECPAGPLLSFRSVAALSRGARCAALWRVPAP